MAPRRSGGGGSSSSSSWDSDSSVCAGAFSNWGSQTNLAYYVLFLVMFIGTAFSYCCIRKQTGPGKKLVGPVYIFSLLFAIVSLALDLANLIMSECTFASTGGYYSISIASVVLYHLSCLGLLYVVLYKLNSMLREKLGSIVKAFKTALLVIFGVMGAVYIAYIALTTYVQSNSLYYFDEVPEDLINSTRRLSMATRVLYMLCVLASTVLAAMTVFSLRRGYRSGGGLIGWVFALHAFMFIWAVIAVALTALSYSSVDVSLIVSFTLAYILAFFQVLSYITLLTIARHICWKDDNSAHPVFAPVMHEQPAHGYGNGA